MTDTTFGVSRDELDSLTDEDLGDPVHVRTYDVAVYRAAANRMVIRARLHDVKPDGLLPEDPDPLSVHDMEIEVEIRVPDMTIMACRPVMKTFPHTVCLDILGEYDKVVGLSIARGFTHKVRAALGGPRGCTHLTMLLQALAPVAIQGMYAFTGPGAQEDWDPPEPGSPEETALKEAAFALNRDSCHVWASDGPMKTRLIDNREEWAPPLWAVERAEKMGIDPAEWRRRRRPRSTGQAEELG